MNDETQSKAIFGVKIAQLSASVTKTQKSLLANISTIAAAQEKTLQHEIKRKMVKYGKESNEVREIAARLSADNTVRLQLCAQAQRADVTTPERQADRFVLHGRVVDNDGLGICDLVVSGVDFRSQEALCHSSTDRNGYFKLELYSTAKESKSAGKNHSEGPAIEAQRNRFLLQVLNKGQCLLYCDDNTHSIMPGSVVYKEIIISDEEK